MPKSSFSIGSDEFRAMLRALRLEKGLTQVDLAARLGLPQSYVSKYETGERRVDFVETALICDALGIGIESFAARFAAQKRGKARRSTTQRL